MGFDVDDWSDQRASPAGQLREQRSGLPGFGARPALHPAWRLPQEPDGGRRDGQGGSGRAVGS